MASSDTAALDAPVLELVAARDGGLVRRVLRRRSVRVATVALGLLTLIAIVGPLFTVDPAHQVLSARNAGPSWAHPFGTDELGRDMLARTISGARISLFVAVIGAVSSVAVGVPLGALAGYRAGWVDTAIARAVDSMYAIPDLLLAILIGALVRGKVDAGAGGVWSVVDGLDAALGGLLGLVVALVAASWVVTFRLVRSATLSLKEREFAKASVASGASGWYVVRRHLLPNMLAPVLVAMTIVVPSAILLEAGLSFIGIGAQPPTASWGVMISEGTASFEAFPHELIVPAAAIGLTLLAVTVVGDGLRAAVGVGADA